MMVLIFVLLALLHSVCAFTVEDEAIMTVVPKIELHAHLHGSIRMDTLQELVTTRNLPINLGGELNLEKCFKLFANVHKLINNIDVVKRVTREVLADYMAENTIYLELRTTPRNLSDGTSPETYVETLVELIQQHNIESGHIMLVKLILSIDRSSRFKEAIDISELAGDYRFYSNGSDYPVRTIVGLDFSGNPLGGKFEDFSPLFDTARERNLGITLHAAELKELSDSVDPVTDEDDTESILNFRPERIGHALHLQQHHIETLLMLKDKKEAPGIEICPTSNKITLGLTNYADHPYLRDWLTLQYPISINTDDRGIFNTTLTKELLYVKDAMGLDLADMVQILDSTIDQSFATAEEKNLLHGKFWSQVKRIIGNNPDAVLFKPVKRSNVKDMQDMSYMLYI